MMRTIGLSSLAFAMLLTPLAAHAQVPPGPGEWTAYGRDAAGTRYSPLTEIHAGNVADLEVAWVYRTGDLMLDRGRFQSTPLMVDGRLYVSSPLGRVSAVNPIDGGELWTFDPGVDLRGSYGDFANRGVSYWRISGPMGGLCDSRVFVATIDARLIALDAARGLPCPDFGAKGTVDLKEGLRNPPTHLGEYQVTSPPAVVGDAVVVGSAIADNQRRDAPSGVVQAFDARAGQLLWSWDPVPRDSSDPARETWTGSHAHDTGAANTWAPISADSELGLVYVPTSSASPDFYGGERIGRNDYANSVVALDAATGTVRWHFQVVHHDLWDYDVPAQPVLFPFRRDGQEIAAVAVATKMGHLFILDRRTGEPIHPVEERAVPASTVPGEQAWPTQPFPVRPASFAPQQLRTEDQLGLTEDDGRWCRDRLAGLRNEGIFTPPSLEGTVIVPGNVGGMHWGGLAVDPVRAIGVAPTNRLPFVVTLVPRDEMDAARLLDGELSSQRGTPYGMRRELLLAPSGAPCSPPPWGALTAVDLVSGERLWQEPLGSAGEAAPEGSASAMAASLGSPNLGGPLITAGGLAFMAGTPDRSLRAFDIETGQALWSGTLPADAIATPMTYSMDGVQYIVVAAGGHDGLRMVTGTPLSDHLVAFALPSGVAGARPPADPTPLGAGSWTGEIRGGQTRFSASLHIRDRDGARRGVLTVGDGRFEADLAITDADGELRLTGRFHVDDGCTGSAALEAELANHGSLLVGRFRLDGPCFEDDEEAGTFSFRKS